MGSNIAVNNVFLSIQGEGPFTGHPALFIRLAGCNLKCPACDTDHSPSESLAVTSLMQKVSIHLKENPRVKLIVVTGGEPFLQKSLPSLCMGILGLDPQLKVQIETNGSMWRKDMDIPLIHYGRRKGVEQRLFVVCSPKTNIHPDVIRFVDAWKYVVGQGVKTGVTMDGFPTHALGNSDPVQHPPKGHKAPVYIQPQDYNDKDHNARALKICIGICKQYGYILCVQVHKLIGVE